MHLSRLSLLSVIIVACAPQPELAPNQSSNERLDHLIGDLPELQIEGLYDGEAPVYVFLKAHTEDHFNHTLSEERYRRIVPMLEAVDPAAHPVWTVQFQGADAKTVSERDLFTGVATMLRDAAADGLVQFGYHGQHDPTELNRPQRSLRSWSTWPDIARALESWVSCEKHPTLGDCVAPTGGGIDIIEEAFGPVTTVSGLDLGTAFEGSVGRHVVAGHAPDRQLGFGFTDHADEGIADYQQLVDDLLTILTPSGETSATLVWIEDTLRISDGNHLTDTTALKFHDTTTATDNTFATLGGDRPHVLMSGLGTKYIYTAPGSSPTIYGYGHPDDPQLPDDEVNPRFLIDQYYQNIEDNFAHLTDTVFVERPGSRFVDAGAISRLADTADHREVTEEELDVIARWTLDGWTADGPPAFVSDGHDFYSLRDAVGLLAMAMDGQDFPLDLPRSYGPRDEVAAAPAGSLAEAELPGLAARIAGDLGGGDEPWSTRPTTLRSSYRVASMELNLAQALHALAQGYAAQFAGLSTGTVLIEPSPATPPSTTPIVEGLDCLTPVDTAWSLKPARLDPSAL